jgi:hypothetical protein
MAKLQKSIQYFEDFNKTHRRHATQIKTEEEIEERRHSVFKQLKVICSHIEFSQGQKHWNKAVFEAEHLDMDEVYNALDCYKNAVNLAMGVDIELEAMASHFLGKIHYKGLRNMGKAKKHYTDSLRLAHTLHPRDVS